MKRLALITVALFVLSGAAMVFAQEEEIIGGPQVLIDFSSLEETEIDFTKFPGAMAEGITELTVDLSLGNWKVNLAPSSASSENRILSYTKAVNSAKMEGDVLGVRVHFPDAPFNSWAKVVPPFEIPFYEDKEGEPEGSGTKFVNKGVLRNVGTIKSVTARVTGRNFPYSLSVALKNEQDAVKDLFLGYLDFDGWKTMTWGNPNYITDVKQRDLRKTPLYPETMPSIKFEYFTIFRQANQIGGDFVTYIKDVQLVYDLAILELDRDIDDEASWGILGMRRDAKRAAEIRRLGILQLLRRQETDKMKHAQTE
ncbi:MAG TPA: flagellar protein [Spirochaetes bacterium]|nr:flagellar protein [Spirochaetota bacterium]